MAGWRISADEASVPVLELGETEDAFVPSAPARVRYRRGALVRRMLLTADVAGLMLAFATASIVLPTEAGVDRVTPGYEFLAFLIAIPLWTLLMHLEGLYDR